MRIIAVVTVCFCILATLAWGVEPISDFKKSWSQWRGPEMTGVAPYGEPPVEWGEDKNIRWKIEIPGKGHASPIVWDDKIFVSTAIETDTIVESQKVETEQQSTEPQRGRRGRGGAKPTKAHKFVIFAIDRQDGKTLWQQTAREELPHEGTHAEGSWASNSPVTDGEHVYAYFGSRGLYCYDMQGNPVWEKDLGDMNTKRSFGEGSSPALYGNAIIVNWDHEGQSFIVALDKKTGEELWKVDRDEATSWATPIVVEHDGKPQVIISATNRIRSYDLATGKQIWECGGMTANVIPTPVVANGIAYFASGFRGNALLAIRLDMFTSFTDDFVLRASGDITDSDAIVWRHDKDTPYAPSMLLYEDTLYFLLTNNGFLSCFDAKTGQEHYSRQKLEGISDTFVSPVGAQERVYLTGSNGTTLVIKRGPKFEILATNSLDDNFTASPAIVDKEIYLRGHKYLYCIAQD